MAFSPSARFNILRRDGFRCTYCGRSPSDGVQLHVDHVVSRRDGGSDDPENLTTACRDCNLGKGSASLGPKCCLCGGVFEAWFMDPDDAVCPPCSVTIRVAAEYGISPRDVTDEIRFYYVESREIAA